MNKHLQPLTLSAALALTLATAQSGHAQTLYVSSQNSGDIYAFDSSGNESTFASGVGSVGLAFAPAAVPEASTLLGSLVLGGGVLSL